MNNREKDLIAIRPQIPSISETATSPMETFQNKTIRPILKLQNEILIQAYRSYILKRKNVFHTKNPQQKEAYIEHSIQKDLKFKNYLLGLVHGHFTLEEWQAFQQYEAELNRRICQMMIKRLSSQLAI